MSSSRAGTLESVCTLIADCPHSTPRWTDSGFLVIRNQNIKNGKLDLSERSYTDREHYQIRVRRAKPQFGDLIITREAPMGDVCMVPEGLECCVGQRQVLLRPNPEKIVPRFLLYAIQSPAVQHEISWSEGTGSTVSNIRIPVLKSIKVPIPPLTEQKWITEILGALDDRIALLRETNVTLEAIAQALFKSWFIDFDPVRAKQQGLAPEGMDKATAALFPDGFEESELGLVPKDWPVGILSDFVVTSRNQLQPSDLHAELKYVGLEHIPRKSLGLTAWDTAGGLESAKAAFSEGDILFGKLRPYFHKVVVAPFDGVCSTDILVCRPRLPEHDAVAAMLLSSVALIDYADRLSNGAKMPRVTWKDLAAYRIVKPPQSVVAEYNRAVLPLLEKIKANVLSAQTLATLRDTLLPRLISGQLRLPEAQAALEGALP
ncbi:restriction endonuclease subunit S [Hydrogenophaga sp.]|uniref:restriction endonuclease subunit S n=1 Tax=Hydrogenophaga sp. TaxID=1904254 RepID=UPI0035B0B76E